MLFTIYPIVFQQHRGWNSGVGALPLIGSMVGACIAGAIVFYESTLAKKKMLAGVERTPEDRMPLVRDSISNRQQYLDLFKTADFDLGNDWWRALPSDHVLVSDAEGQILRYQQCIDNTLYRFAWSANYNSVHWAVPTLVGKCSTSERPSAYLGSRLECFSPRRSY